MFDLVLFDLDGTLVDTADDLADSVNDVLGELGLEPVAADMARTWIGHGSRELITQAVAYRTHTPAARVRAERSEDLLQRFSAVHDLRCGSRSRLYPGVVESLKALDDLGLRMGVVTNREIRLGTRVLRTHGLYDWFNPIIGGDSLPARKPDALPIEHCMQLHEVPPERTLMVGDSSVDVAAGRNAGVTMWAVPYGYNGGRPIAEAGPDRVISGLPDIVRALREGHCPNPSYTNPQEKHPCP